MKEIVKLLKGKNKTISTMESCTGGGVANAITNIKGSSEVLKFSAVTYSNEFKIKMGIPKSLIDKYTVYSMEVAIAMSHSISEFTNSNYGVGVTGTLKAIDPNNKSLTDDMVYINIYDADNNKDYNITHHVTKKTRSSNKLDIINLIESNLKNIIK